MSLSMVPSLREQVAARRWTLERRTNYFCSFSRRFPSANGSFPSLRLIYLPTTVAAKVIAAIGGKLSSSGAIEVPCSSPFSTFALEFAGVQYQIPLEDLFLGCMCLPLYTQLSLSNLISNSIFIPIFLDASSSTTTVCLIGVFGIDQEDPNGNPVAIVRLVFSPLIWYLFLTLVSASGWGPFPQSGLLRLFLLSQWISRRRSCFLHHQRSVSFSISYQHDFFSQCVSNGHWRS